MVTSEGHDPRGDDRCQLCTQPRAMHDGSMIRHEFVELGQDPGSAIKQPKKKDKPSTVTPQLVIMPQPDIVLRQALIKAGIITRTEVEAMERELTISQTPRLFADPADGQGDSSHRP